MGTVLPINKKFTDYHEIQKEIEQETLCSSQNNKLPILLRIYSHTGIDLGGSSWFDESGWMAILASCYLT